MKTALVTGGARGIGREVARLLASETVPHPWQVLVAARNRGKAEAAAVEMGPRARAVVLDLRAHDTFAAFAAGLAAAGTPLDLLIQNAAVYREPDEEVWAVNLRGPILLDRALDGVLAADATVVHVTSGLGALAAQPASLRRRLTDPALTIDDLLALPPAGYGESKAALNALTGLLARQWPSRAVNSVSPGWVRTEMGGRGAPRSIAQGAASILHAARLRPGQSGRVYEDGREIGA